MRIVLLAALLFALSLAPAAWAAERAIAYADMHEVFSRVELLQGGTYFKADARLSSSDPAVPTSAVTLVVKSRGGEIVVPISAEGITRFPIRADLLAENPSVMTNAAAGTLQFQVSVRVEAPLVQRFKYGLMVAMQDEAAAMVAKQGFMARLLMPDFEGLAIGFPAGTAASATVESSAGPKRFDASADGVVHIPDTRAWRKEDPFVQLSALPSQISLDVD